MKHEQTRKEVKAIETGKSPQQRIIVNLQPDPAEPVIRSLPDSHSDQLDALAIGRQLALAERRKAAHLRREAMQERRQARQAAREARALRRQARLERLRSRELVPPAFFAGLLGWLSGRREQAQHGLEQRLDKLGHELAEVGHSLEHGFEKGIKRIRPRSRRILPWRSQSSQLLPKVGIGLGVLAGGLALFGAYRLLSKALARRKAHQDLVGEVGEMPMAFSVELGELTGTWFELARLPHGQEKNAVGCELQVSRVDERELAIRYTCELEGFSGQRHEARYKVKLLEDGRMRLHSFPWVFTYVLIEQTPDYLVIGGENHKHLWLLARSHSLPEVTYDALIARLAAQGFDIDKLVKVRHLEPGESPYQVTKRAMGY